MKACFCCQRELFLQFNLVVFRGMGRREVRVGHLHICSVCLSNVKYNAYYSGRPTGSKEIIQRPDWALPEDVTPFYTATLEALCTMLIWRRPPYVSMGGILIGIQCKKRGRDLVKSLDPEQQVELDHYLHSVTHD
jgi:hypothetical protein